VVLDAVRLHGGICTLPPVIDEVCMLLKADSLVLVLVIVFDTGVFQRPTRN
jgi:hypothetical protein